MVAVNNKVVATQAGLIVQSSPEGKGTLPITPYAELASSQYRLRYGVDKEQCEG
jgi:hypothetical protein